MSALIELARTTLRTNDARLTGEITREAHARVIATVNDKLTELGYTWDDLSGELIQLITAEDHPELAPDVTFRRTGATAPTTPLHGSAPGGAHG